MSQDNPYAASRPNYQNQLDMLVPPHVPDYLVWSILTTLFCCQPLGIAGIIFSAMANSAKQQGDFQTAMAYAKNAKLCPLIGVVGILVLILCMICFVVLPGNFRLH